MDGAMAATKQADNLGKQYDVLYKQLTEPDRSMTVCDICGVFINSTDNEQRRLVSGGAVGGGACEPRGAAKAPGWCGSPGWISGVCQCLRGPGACAWLVGVCAWGNPPGGGRRCVVRSLPYGRLGLWCTGLFALLLPFNGLAG